MASGDDIPMSVVTRQPSAVSDPEDRDIANARLDKTTKS